jgi:RNA polymerase sigma-70 factor (ECF subfamily)
MKNLDEPKVVGVINLSVDPPQGGRRPVVPPESGSISTTDSTLVRALRADDPKVLKQLMDTHWAPLVGFAHRMLSGGGDPEDVVQTAFVRLWSRRRQLDEAGSLKSLLYTIVRNGCLDEIRKRTRREDAHRGAIPPSSPKTPYEDVQGAELQRLAAAAVARLPDRRREVFRLAREEGLSYQEIAEVMDLSTQTVANHMSLAMADLRAALRPYFSDRTPSAQDAGEAGPDREKMDG